MFTPQDNVLMIDHSDLDAAGCLTLAKYFLKDQVKVLNYFLIFEYSEVSEAIPQKYIDDATIILFTDISPDLDTYKRLEATGKRIIIIDHHKSAWERLHEYVTKDYIYDETLSGTKLFYKYLTEGKRVKPIVREFVDLVDAYDMWREESPLWEDAKKIQNVLWGYVDWKMFGRTRKDLDPLVQATIHDAFVSTQLRKFKTSEDFYFSEHERGIIKRAEIKEEAAFLQAKKSMDVRTDGGGDKYAYIECSSKLSVTANRVLKEFSETGIKYIVGYATWDKSAKKFSLRSVDDFDVSKVAELWGGGGHSHAAGVEFASTNPKNTPHNFELIRKGQMHLK